MLTWWEYGYEYRWGKCSWGVCGTTFPLWISPLEERELALKMEDRVPCERLTPRVPWCVHACCLSLGKVVKKQFLRSL